MYDKDYAEMLLNISGLIVRAENGGPIRTFAGRLATRPQGRYPSRKSGWNMPYEAMHERKLIHICEADTAVVSYLSQPHKVVLNLKNRMQQPVYFPDLERVFADGSIEVVETKKTLDEVSNNEAYEEKLSLVTELYRREGITFTIVDDKELSIEPRLSNAMNISHSGKTLLQTRDLMVFGKLAQAALTFGDLVQALSKSGSADDPAAKKKVFAMVVRRIAHLDLDHRILRNTPVTAVGDPDSFRPSPALNGWGTR